jgi:RNA polymerase sigma-70 factor (ECF subfamily)
LKKNVEIGDATAFRSLFLTYGPRVRALMMRQGADRDAAEDIAQETMLAVWAKPHLFSRQKGTLSAWIFAIARNLKIDRARRQIAWQRIYSDYEDIQRLSLPEAEADSAESDRIAIERAFESLPPEQRQILSLSYVMGLSQRDIAKELGLPLGTVKSRMRLAFGKLRGSEGGEA